MFSKGNQGNACIFIALVRENCRNYKNSQRTFFTKAEQTLYTKPICKNEKALTGQHCLYMAVHIAFILAVFLPTPEPSPLLVF